jgi:hypothetical protein
MISSMAAYGATAGAIRREPGWIYKPSWDLPLIIFSAVLVPLPFLLAVAEALERQGRKVFWG